MTDQQLYFAIGVPLVFNMGMMLLGFTLISNTMNKRIDDLRSFLNTRFDDMERHFDEKLKRVEDVLDARLKHLEER